jgi:hypothetical protein
MVARVAETDPAGRELRLIPALSSIMTRLSQSWNLTMRMKLSARSDAPPTSTPSISG